MFLLVSPMVQRAQAREQFHVLGGALELLQSPQLTQRLSGIYALEMLAQDETARESAIEILSALVRRRARRVQIPRGEAALVADDVQAALAVLGRCALSGSAQPLDLHGISLRGAFLPEANFAGAFLYDCDLEGALLQDADLSGAWLWRTNLRRVNLDGADLRGADLGGALHLSRDQIAAAHCDENTRLPKLS